ncbi:MAG: hypothetical protein ACXWJE_10430 [Burkholderiaceae bacterium]
MNLDLIVSPAKVTLQRVSERLSGSLNASAIKDFVRIANEVGPFDDYKIFPQAARLIVPTGLLADGADASRLFLKAAIMQGLIDMLESTRFAELPPRVRAQQIRQLQRIASDADDTAEWLKIDHDLFHKEFGIATLRLYVVGAQLADFRCGIPRSTLLKGGVQNLPKNVAKILRLGGFRKYFQLHTHKFMLDAFNEEGWNECYFCCAELYRLHPEVLGMYGSSWFYDPALDEISPRLAYLRAVPLAGGAELFFVEEGGSASNNSLATSPTRRKLYEEGKYMPKSYMLAWGRSSQIAWARKHVNPSPQATGAEL